MGDYGSTTYSEEDPSIIHTHEKTYFDCLANVGECISFELEPMCVTVQVAPFLVLYQFL